MLPPLSALRCFEVASHAKNFSAAAEILCITPSAVSHQIKTLEVFLGRQLFVRNNRSMQLTSEGKLYATKLSRVFTEIEEATNTLLALSQAPRLVVQVPPSLAHSWLVPRLADFVRRYSEIRIQLVTDTNVEQSVVNCEIRYGHGKWPNIEAQVLWIERLRPLVSRSGPKLSSIEDLEHVTLVHTRSRQHGWKELLASHGLDQRAEAGRASLSFDRTGLALEAAVAGLGVALESPVLAGKQMREGLLTAPLQCVEIADEGYYFVHPKGPISLEVDVFKSWVLEHAPALGVTGQ